MKKVTIAICDCEQEYSEKLAEYLLEQKANQIDVFVYSTVELLEEAVKQNEIQVVLFDMNFIDLTTLEKMQKSNADILFGCLASEPVKKEYEQYLIVNKFQSAEEIVRRIYLELAESRKEEGLFVNQKQEIMGIFSPGQSELSIIFSMTLAELLAQDQKVLYISFQECAGFSEIFEKEYTYDLADLVGVNRMQNRNREAYLAGVVHKLKNADYIPPVQNPENASELTAKDYQELLHMIREQSNYEVVILEFGPMTSGIYEIMAACNCIYVPMREGYLQRCRMEQFNKALKMAGNQIQNEKMYFLQMPRYFMGTSGGEDFIESLLWSELGDYIRNKVIGADAHG